MDHDIELVDVPPQHVAVVRADVDVGEFPGFLGGAFEEVMTVLAQQGLDPTGPPLGRYVPVAAGRFRVEAGFPAARPVTASGRVVPAELPGGTVARCLHRGPYEEVAAVYRAVTDWVEDHGLTVSGPPWECYLDEPDVPQPRTEVLVPCAAAEPAG
ncbi:GyrI-like domain-containing protein [Nocardioides euryhalodurans]|uniref:Transcriptional regulator n=1 Tax=Nocardioides euryhalodurans TaxID=2518370 RepID=A0A4P7GIS5_9ACTN|nr:GyrI-like domain-containing protein [Nocardioides euryhalodurans]QBR91521.1 transcriptional regulator [Nocardioides euryhalodurans]